MKLLKLLKIVCEDKKYGSENRNKRVNEINTLLGSFKEKTTNPYITDSGNKYVVTYRRGQFYYDDKPITLKEIWRNNGFWHVWHWSVFEYGGRCGHGTSIVSGRFSKIYIYKFLEMQSEHLEGILLHK